jgi:hypothetical protein
MLFERQMATGRAERWAQGRRLWITPLYVRGGSPDLPPGIPCACHNEKLLPREASTAELDEL